MNLTGFKARGDRAASYCEALSAFCAGRGMSYVRAETQVPFEDLVLRVFRMGGFLR